MLISACICGHPVFGIPRMLLWCPLSHAFCRRGMCSMLSILSLNDRSVIMDVFLYGQALSSIRFRTRRAARQGHNYIAVDRAHVHTYTTNKCTYLIRTMEWKKCAYFREHRCLWSEEFTRVWGYMMLWPKELEIGCLDS